MLQRLLNAVSTKKKESPSEEVIDAGENNQDGFNALDFYQNLQDYKQTSINSELGENNNAVQNLAISNYQDDESHEEKKEEVKPINGSDIVKLDEKTQFLSEQVPNKLEYTINVDNSRVYGGRFTSKGNLYYCSSQDIIGIYNSSNPYKFKKIKSINALDINWTITSMDTTEDEEYLVYSSISPFLHIVDLQTLCKFHTKIDLSNSHSSHQYPPYEYGGYFGIFNCKFSGDGKELVCVTNSAHIIVYDLEHEQKVLDVAETHGDDINAVCFANRTNSNILFTGSDDYFIKVWDRRIMEGNSPIGCFIGHREGITSIDSRGDERYVVSNSKDQTMKLWDLRKMNDPCELNHKSSQKLCAMAGFDYRWMDYTYKKIPKHEKDRSVMTFQGHTVLQTLIRCYFSPLETTGQRYLYSGSADGCVCVYDILTGESKSCVSNSTGECIRDVAWHPKIPVIASTSFGGKVDVFSTDHSLKYIQRNARPKNQNNNPYGIRSSWVYSESSDGYFEGELEEYEEEDESYCPEE